MSGIAYDFTPEREEARRNPLRRALEDYGLRPDVHELLSRFVTDLLQASPPDPSDFMLRWAEAERKNSGRMGSPLDMDLENEKYNLNIDLTGKGKKGQGSTRR
ncbi:hypothetical protein MPTK1_7g13210 [Marchantia polymorpha subsp. ruderalis]|uniref:Uncharacterized protein n=2 Tax=Marchantia polymorpha TaxID=3197 RepID=A0AAF6BZ32_MARPO|nr:hypothetical protein MARPO_0009s0007 [Marchantia polymorpha]PTQ46873.1 hypothetical protein MARPO_0009s0007 [Marchantia polymorpha]BBN17266.1 hypothetical protein Mp_7g13210 [Marchantia polymorpha subsp. ruderalis]BBN17267.1 hypothetical protein Mp_7g13210 [Marchantia polymorpha subsp. ruderalis]|eukprot:PTQ46872.1 hypothetical protein MARPO_0009s0007 [Marchantia polymorpha]